MCPKKTRTILFNLNLRIITMVVAINCACKRNLNIDPLPPHDGHVQSDYVSEIISRFEKEKNCLKLYVS